MKKGKKQQESNAASAKNLVAKHAHHFNKALIFKDKSKYQRKAKHKNSDPFFMQCRHCIKKGSLFPETPTTFSNIGFLS